MAQKLNYQVLCQKILLVGILLLALSACNLKNQPGGADTAEEVVNTYSKAHKD